MGLDENTHDCLIPVLHIEPKPDYWGPGGGLYLLCVTFSLGGESVVSTVFDSQIYTLDGLPYVLGRYMPNDHLYTDIIVEWRWYTEHKEAKPGPRRARMDDIRVRANQWVQGQCSPELPKPPQRPYR